MPAHASTPIPALPDNYREVYYLNLSQWWKLAALNVLALFPLVASGLVIFGLLIIYHASGAPLVIDALPDELPTAPGLILILLILPLHEWIHGVWIKRAGYRPRYGVKLLVLFATADGALFRRNQFIGIALAPLGVITLGGLVVMLFLPAGLAQWIALAGMLNAAGAIGDLWMTVAALRYPPSTLIRDEEDGMRIFAQVR